MLKKKINNNLKIILCLIVINLMLGCNILKKSNINLTKKQNLIFSNMSDVVTSIQDNNYNSKINKNKVHSINKKIYQKKENTTTLHTNNKNTFWKPTKKESWQIQFTGKIDLDIDADVFDLDLFDTPTKTIQKLHSQGKKVVCYINVGSYENWRPDKDLFLKIILGNDYENWPGEKWLDIRKLKILGPIIEKRLDLCKKKGFDGVDADNVNGYTNKTGFNITYQDQLRYNIWLSNKAHEKGLSIGLKNNENQIEDLLSYYDWGIVENCYKDKFCDKFKLFVLANKTVWQIEYTNNNLNFHKICNNSKKLSFNVIFKNHLLNSWRQICL